MKNWFSSDWHLDHHNIIKYDGRPFKRVEEMNDVILSNCEKVFRKGDNFYYLGDFCLGSWQNSERFLDDLKATGVNMFFIKGNHDKSDMIKLYNRYGTYLGEQKKVRVNEQEIVLNHYRMDVWDKSHHGSWHLHGHSHHSLPERPKARCIDVGINGKDYNYSPLEFSDVAAYMAKKTWEPIDHHGRK